jgi:hypothetical protein
MLFLCDMYVDILLCNLLAFFSLLLEIYIASFYCTLSWVFIGVSYFSAFYENINSVSHWYLLLYYSETFFIRLVYCFVIFWYLFSFVPYTGYFHIRVTLSFECECIDVFVQPIKPASWIQIPLSMVHVLSIIFLLWIRWVS